MSAYTFAFASFVFSLSLLSGCFNDNEGNKKEPVQHQENQQDQDINNSGHDLTDEAVEKQKEEKKEHNHE